MLRDGELIAMSSQPGVIPEHLTIDEMEKDQTHPQGEEELVPC